MNLRDLLSNIRQSCSGLPEDWIQFDVGYLTDIAASIEKSLTNRCRNCRHWADNIEMESHDIGALAADGPTHPMDAWPCLHPKIGGGYSGEEHKSSDAVNSYSTIITGPEFGCIHFEEAAQATPPSRIATLEAEKAERERDETIHQLRAKLSEYEQAPTVAAVMDTSSENRNRELLNGSVVRFVHIPQVGTELIARPTRKDGE